MEQSMRKKLARGLTIDIEDDILYRRLKKKIQERNDQRNADDAQASELDQAEDDNLFVQGFPMHDDLVAGGMSQELNQTLSANEISNMLETPKTGKRKAKQTDEVVDDDSDAVQEPKKTRKKAGKAAGNAGATKGTKKMTAKGKAKQGKGKKVTKKQEAILQHNSRNITNLNNLGSMNVFQDYRSNTARTELPGFTGKRKENALKDLIASIPSESTEEEQSVRRDMQQLLAASKIFGQGQCKVKDGTAHWKLKGLSADLTNYQMLGASTMRKREIDTQQPRGGLLADAMGLGKTVIAVIVNGRRNSKLLNDPEEMATLVVVPASLLDQWDGELKRHSENLTVYRHHTGSRQPRADEYFRTNCVVLTTYAEVARSYPRYKPPPNLTTNEQKEAWWKQELEKNAGVLHKTVWRRVVLDEAQAIKNVLSLTSVACRALQSSLRWAVTATPMQNSPSEFYPFFTFLKVPNTGSLQTFNKNYCQDDQDCRDRLAYILKSFMIRRNHNDQIFGAKLLVLPEPHQKTLYCNFTPVEREIYQIVRRRFVERINVLAREDEPDKQFRCVLTMLLRLRQLTAHILLLQDTVITLLEKEDIFAIRAVLARPVEPGSSQEEVIVHLRKMLKQPETLIPLEDTLAGTSTRDSTPASAAASSQSSEGVHAEINDGEAPLSERMIEHTKPSTTDVEGKDAVQSPSTAPATMDQAEIDAPPPQSADSDGSEAIGTSQQRTKAKDDAHPRCVACQSKLSAAAHFLSCQHILCGGCILKLGLCDSPTCPKCNKVTAGTSQLGPQPTSGAAVKKKPPTRKAALETIDNWIDKNGNMLPSAKTTAVKSQVLQWLDESPDDKIIIYTQFNVMIHIISKMCKIEGWGSCVFTGKMSLQERNQVLHDFQTKPSLQIMVTSMKVGGTGLNLYKASKAMEQQAFGRVFRRGQEKETYLLRLAVADTVDMAILSMQERKDEQVDAVMGSRNDKPSVKELMRLFGPTAQDDNGNEFIIPDGADMDEANPRMHPHRAEGNHELFDSE
ncbi:hypothetical protein MRB53_038931 [Persea americana]|nr:hypothetical protein MRB53_038931 [Persea americana]